MSNPYQIRMVKCANCGKHRQEANHWFVTAVEKQKFHCAPLESARRLRGRDEPACGQQCAQKLFEKYLASSNQQLAVAIPGVDRAERKDQV